MTITRAFTEQLHPRGTGAVGGQFVAAGTGPAAAKKAPAGTKKPAGNLSFDGKRGPGYGMKGGDKRVKGLQEALNRLGMTDSRGKKLAVDGKLGPKTTAAIKKAQRALGLKADGVVSPALLSRLSKAKSIKDEKAKSAKKAVKPAKKAATPRVPAPKRSGKGGERAPSSTLVVRYSAGMTDATRHASHNQKSHGNRLGRPGNVPGRTGLASRAEKARVGTNDVRMDDEVTIIRDPTRAGSPPAHLGKKGTVIDADGGNKVIVEFDDGGQAEVFKGHIRVDRTRNDPTLEEERRKKLDAEVKAIRDRTEARRKGQP